MLTGMSATYRSELRNRYAEEGRSAAVTVRGRIERVSKEGEGYERARSSASRSRGFDVRVTR
jgi:hypothetical protein